MFNFLTKIERKSLYTALKIEKDSRLNDRIKVVLLLDKGIPYSRISEDLFLDEGSIANYKKRYRENGIKGLLNDNYSGKASMLTSKEERLLSNHLEEVTYLSADKIILYIKKTFKKKYSKSGVIKLLHRLGFTYKKPKLVPGKANRKEQLAFRRKLKKLLDSANPVYFSDGVHPQHNTIKGYGWIKKGKDNDKIVLSNSGRQRLNLFGAISLKDLNPIIKEYDTLNGDNICDFLRILRSKHKDGKLINFILDSAKYNVAYNVKKLAKQLNIKLIYLPFYSPNLNLIERLWKFFKKKVLYNQYYEKFIDFKVACLDFFKHIKNFKDEIKSLLTPSFQIFGT